ncbi:MAG: hypothetical protein Q9220_006517 [cf. Caloplaca sp. 1 TL-2023]
MAGEKPYSALRKPSGNESDQTEQEKGHHGEQQWRLIITVIIVILVIVVVKVYENKGAVAHDDKYVFNTVITVLNLALGLNFLEAFKDMAKVLRWRVLANRKFTVRETDLILGGESLMKLVTLMRESMRKPLTLFVCVCWIALNLLGQASVAMIGLTYSYDNGLNSSTITTSQDFVSVPRVDCYYNNGTCTTSPTAPPEIAQNEAHSYGEITPGDSPCWYNTDDDIYKSPQDCSYFQKRGGLEYAYRFNEYNPGDLSRAYPFLTKRLIKTSPGQCYQYSARVDGFTDSPDGPESMITYAYSNQTFNGTISVSRPDTALDSTTYVYNGVWAPQNASAAACGPRCIWIYAIRQSGPVTGNRPLEVFQCPITVSNVTNIGDSAHVVPDDTARMAAASIALSGRYTNPDADHPGQKHWTQFQLYPYG